MTVRESVLDALKKNRGSYLSGEELSATLKVSRAAVWKAIKALREDSYAIEAVSGRGYILHERNNPLTESTVRYALSSDFRRRKLFVFDTVDSTNLCAKRLILENAAAEGDVIISNQQSEGRGRLGRSFFSPDEGIYLSLIIKPDFDTSNSSLITVAAAAAVARAISDVCGQQARIKWVNDIYIDKKKVCGILTEAMTDFESGQITSLIVGIGINTDLKGFPSELLDIAGAVDLKGAESSDIPGSTNIKALLAASVIENTFEYASQICDDNPEFMDLYRSLSLLDGKEIRVFKGVYRQDPAAELGGRPARVIGIDDRGGLEVLYTDGSRETLTSGEVSVRL